MDDVFTPIWESKLPSRHLQFLRTCEDELLRRMSNPPMEHWFCGDDDDEGESYCLDCIMAIRPTAEPGEDYLGAYPPGESDSVAICERCGALLQYTLTDYGLQEELAHFSETDSQWDWDNPDQCYEVQELCGSVYTDKQRVQLLVVS